MKQWSWWGAGAVVLLLAAAWMWLWGSGSDDDPAHQPSVADTAQAPDAAVSPASAVPVVVAPSEAAASTASPEALMAEYRDSGGRAHAKHAGKRLTLKGAVASVEAGENGLVLVSLDAGPDLPPARAVMATADAAQMRAWPQGAPVALDCANQGLLMGEPLLADCRVLKD
ncbi:MAG TPA: OB-fold putative lipoprotein [Candidatus Aquabacterium excrementipullorum]|nr:OB-fold putative lipoprotein [Candidatus Aquabacterium excrementipullorum]